MATHRRPFAFPVTGRPDLAEVGRDLGVEFVVEGAAMRRHERLSVSVTLSHAPSGRRVWGGQYEFAESDLFAMHAEIAAKIISRLVSNIDQAILQQQVAPASLAAFENFTRGVAFLRGYGAGMNERARAHFTRAIELDPECAVAHAYLALAEIIIADYSAAPREVLEAARDRAALAITLEPEESRCHRIMGLIRLYLRDHAAAEQFLRRAGDLNPYDADAIAQLGFVLTMRGRPEEGVAWLRKAIALNPFRPHWYDTDIGYALYCLGHYDEAAEAFSSAPELGVSYRMWLAASLAMAGRPEPAAAAFGNVMRDIGPEDLDRCTRDWAEFEHDADLEHFRRGLRIAGQAFHDNARAAQAAATPVAGSA